MRTLPRVDGGLIVLASRQRQPPEIDRKIEHFPGGCVDGAGLRIVP
jgi:hypothetical protein